MERKLVKQGRNALTVTLPAKWLRKRGLERGDPIYIDEHNENLKISSRISDARRHTSVDVVGAEKGLLWHILNAKYIEGFDIIEIHHDDPSTVQEIAQSFIGMIVEKHSSSRTVVKSIVVVPEENFQAVFRRAAHILVQLGKALERVASGEQTYNEFKREEHLLNGHIIYCLRYLNKYATAEGAYRYFLLCATIEEVGDLLKTMAKRIDGEIKLAKKVSRIVETYEELLFKRDIENLYLQLRKFRNSVKGNTFLDGLAFFLAEILYNYLGYLIEDKK